MTFSIFSWIDKRKRKEDRKPRPQSSQDSGFEGSSISSSSSYATTTSSYTATRRPISAESNLLASPHPRNQQYQPTHQQNHQQPQHHYHTHATIHSISSSRSHPVRQLPFSTSSSSASSWSASAALTPSSKTRVPQYRIFSSQDSLQSPPRAPSHPLLSSSLSTTSSTPPRSHPPVVHRFKTAFVRLLPRRPKKGVLTSSSSPSFPSFRKKARRFSSSSFSTSCATLTASSSFPAVSCTKSSVGNSMFHAGASSRANSSVAEAHRLHPSSGSVAYCFPDPSSSYYSSPSPSTAATSTPVSSTIHPLGNMAPACFPGTGPEDLASKYEQLQQLQQSSTRPSVQRANVQRQQSSQQYHQQHRVLTCPPASIAVTTTGSSVSVGGGEGGGRRHLIPHHHHLQGVAGLGSGGTAVECVCPATPGASGLSCSAPPSPSVTTSPLQNPLPHTPWSSIANDRRSSLSGRSMDEMEVVSAMTLQQEPHHRASLTVHSSASPLVGACSPLPSLDRQRRGSSQSTTSSLVVLRPKILQPQNSSSPLYPYQGDRKSSVASITTFNSTQSPEKPMSSTFGQCYDISTMFNVGPLTLPAPASSIPLPSQPVAAAAPTVMAT